MLHETRETVSVRRSFDKRLKQNKLNAGRQQLEAPVRTHLAPCNRMDSVVRGTISPADASLEGGVINDWECWQPFCTRAPKIWPGHACEK